MTLPTGTISMSQVNTELGRPSTQSINLNDSAVRTLAGRPSGTISMNDLRGKSNIPPVGSAFGGGYIICKSGGTVWIVAPSSTEVSRTWYARNDASTCAQTVTGCTGWFVPSCAQLLNPGYTCAVYWDSVKATRYWSSSEYTANCAWSVVVPSGAAPFNNKNSYRCVRSFRTVSY